MIRINNESLERIETTNLKSEGFYEEDDLHLWFINNPEYFLGEELLVIGHEVQLQATNDRVDVLAIDNDANLTVVELKRGELKSGVEFQALNYVSHIAEWGYDDIEKQFTQFKNTDIGKQLYDQETDLEEELRKFTEQEEIPNADQRIVYIGERLKHRIEKVTQWLSSQGIDITVAVFDLYKDGDQLYLDSSQVLPAYPRANQKTSTGFSKQPWKEQGRDWHLDKMTKEAGDLLESLVNEFKEVGEIGEPSWDQRNYVAFYHGRERIIKLTRRKTQVNVEVDLPEQELEKLSIEKIGSATGIPEDAIEADEGLEIICKPQDKPDIKALVDIISDHI